MLAIFVALTGFFGGLPATRPAVHVACSSVPNQWKRDPDQFKRIVEMPPTPAAKSATIKVEEAAAEVSSLLEKEETKKTVSQIGDIASSTIKFCGAERRNQIFCSQLWLVAHATSPLSDGGMCPSR